jgi:hypothetical protein
VRHYLSTARMAIIKNIISNGKDVEKGKFLNTVGGR